MNLFWADIWLTTKMSKRVVDRCRFCPSTNCDMTSNIYYLSGKMCLEIIYRMILLLNTPNLNTQLKLLSEHFFAHQLSAENCILNNVEYSFVYCTKKMQLFALGFPLYKHFYTLQWINKVIQFALEYLDKVWYANGFRALNLFIFYIKQNCVAKQNQAKTMNELKQWYANAMEWRLFSSYQWQML